MLLTACLIPNCDICESYNMCLSVTLFSEKSEEFPIEGNFFRLMFFMLGVTPMLAPIARDLVENDTNVASSYLTLIFSSDMLKRNFFDL